MNAVGKKLPSETTIIAHHACYPYMFFKATLIVP